MSTEIDEIKNMIKEIAASQDNLLDEDDKLISQIIDIERKHLHRLDGSSEKTRRDEIEKKIKDHLNQGKVIK